MFTVKGFIELPGWESNTADTVARFGELSPIRRTYAKDKGIYGDDNYPNVRLVAFKSDNDTGYAEIPAATVAVILNLANWLRGHAVAGTLSDTPANLQLAITAEFAATVNVLEIGTIDTALPSGYRLPVRIRFNVLGGTETQDVSLWFADAEFAATYPEYSVAVIPPVADLDAFYAQMTSLTQTPYVPRSTPETLALIQTLRATYPETITAGLEYNAFFVNVTDTPSVSTVWTYMTWGIAGENIDIVRTAFQNYILDNSSHTREEWTPVLPDLFLSTEFIIIPGWNVYAIPNQELQKGIYSPQLSYIQINRLLGNGLPDNYLANVAQLQLNVAITATMYMSLGLVTAGGPENREGMERLNQVMPEYIVVPTTSSEFNRMDENTRNWVILLNKALLQAELADDAYELTPGFIRVVRDGKTYISFFYDSVLYLVLTKESLSDQDVNNVLNIDTTGDGTGTAVTYFGASAYFAGGMNAAAETIASVETMDITTGGTAEAVTNLLLSRSQLTAGTNGSRGVFAGGTDGVVKLASIEYFDFALPTIVDTFGNLSTEYREQAAVSGNGYVAFGGGYAQTYTNHLSVIDVATKGNAINFGVLTFDRYGLAGASNNSLGLFGGGIDIAALTVIDSINIILQADASAFASLSLARDHLAAGSNGTTAVFAAGNNGTAASEMDYVVFDTPADATAFGNLTVAVDNLAAAHNDTLVIFAGGYNASGVPITNVTKIDPTSPSNSVAHGNLLTATAGVAGTSGV